MQARLVTAATQRVGERRRDPSALIGGDGDSHGYGRWQAAGMQAHYGNAALLVDRRSSARRCASVARPPAADPAATAAMTSPSSASVPPPEVGIVSAERSGDVPVVGVGLRSRVIRGTLINGGFDIGLAGLGLLRPFVVAHFITRRDFGLWGVVIVSLLALVWFKQVGIADKFIQQSEEDQERAFHRAFTLELGFSLALWALILASLPVFAAIYGRSDIILPGAIVSLVVPLSAFQSPLWVYYRRLEFGRQRTLDAIDPVVALVVTVALAVAGAGYWALVAGAVAGTLAATIAAVRMSPYSLRLSFDRTSLRDYVSFSWPLMAAGATGAVASQGTIITASHVVGLAGVGVIALAHNVSTYSNKVDAIVTRTLYPAVCAVRTRADLLFESFTKSNRVALMWGLPFGVGLALFAPDLVTYVLGDRWRPAVGLLAAYGLIAGFNQIAFNWTAFLRARGETVPIALLGVITLVAFFAAPFPLLIAFGLPGLAAGMGVMTAVVIVARLAFLARLFSAAAMLRHTLRAIVPSVPAAGAVLAVRALEAGSRGGAVVIGELALYALITVGATILVERALVREMIGYLRRATNPVAGVARP